MTAERIKKADKVKKLSQISFTNSYIISFAVKVDTDFDYPNNRKQAMKSVNREHWLKTKKEKMKSHLNNKT
jgi:hypothetical protein